jgi:hypothetical protein
MDFWIFDLLASSDLTVYIVYCVLLYVRLIYAYNGNHQCAYQPFSASSFQLWASHPTRWDFMVLRSIRQSSTGDTGLIPS